MHTFSIDLNGFLQPKNGVKIQPKSIQNFWHSKDFFEQLNQNCQLLSKLQLAMTKINDKMGFFAVSLLQFPIFIR